MLVYTSVTKSYIPKARVLAKSVKKFHPGWRFVLLLSDTLPHGFDLSNEPFDEVLLIDNLGIPKWKSWAFGHKVVELCTAVKGPAAEHFAKREGVSKIMYLDPDIKVYSSLSELESLLDENDILLTPHLLKHEETIDAVMDNEISALKHGAYNLGFFAARTDKQGLDFIMWWSSRLQSFCFDDIPNGLFTDQKWCDLAPSFFSKLLIIRDPGYNVATWNIAHRKISKDGKGTFMAGSYPLKFYHFTSFDNGNGMLMLNKYSDSQTVAYDLWNDYRSDLELNGNFDEGLKEWEFSRYANGEPITAEQRYLYRTRIDVREHFPDPYTSSEPSYFNWWVDDQKLCHSNSSSRLNYFTSILKKFIKSP